MFLHLEMYKSLFLYNIGERGAMQFEEDAILFKGLAGLDCIYFKIFTIWDLDIL